MTKLEVIDLLYEHRNERGISNYQKNPIPGLQSFGMGLGVIKQLAKGLKKDNNLSEDLWQADYLEAKLMACLISLPKELSTPQLEKMALSAGNWMITHTFLQNVMSKALDQVTISDMWRNSEQNQLRCCGFGMLYYLVKDKTVSDDYFVALIPEIELKLQTESNFVKDQMNTALLAIGQRSAVLHKACLAAALRIGKVVVDYGDNSCQAVDVVKHLSSERVLGKFKK